MVAGQQNPETTESAPTLPVQSTSTPSSSSIEPSSKEISSDAAKDLDIIDLPPAANDTVIVSATAVDNGDDDDSGDILAVSERFASAIMFGDATTNKGASVGSSGAGGIPQKEYSTRSFLAASSPSDYDEEDDANQHDGTTVKSRAAKEERKRLGKHETRAILCLRGLVMLLLLLMAATLSVSIYFWVQGSDQDAFESGFSFYSALIQERVVTEIERKLSAVDTMSVMITSHAVDANETFPFVTVPDFEYKGSNERITGDTEMTFYMPYVTNETRAAWENYTQQEGLQLVHSWREEQEAKISQDAKYGLETPQLQGFGLEAIESGSLGDDQDRLPRTKIWDGDRKTYEDGLEAPYFPVWQITPLLPPEVDVINLDVSKYGFARGSIFNTLATGVASLDVVTDLFNNDNDDADAAVFDLLIQSGQYRHRTEHYEGDPVSAVVYPVFEKLGPKRQEEGDKQVVGILLFTLYWRFLFSDILPPEINGLICVLENSFGQVYSYQINGEEAIFLGKGDLHDERFDEEDNNHVLQVDIATMMASNSRPDTRSFTAVELNDEYLNYKLRVYPSNMFQEIYLTGEAKSEALGVLMIFVVVIAIFVVYDCCVQRRQRIVMDRAVKATAVVSSLYPETVREQIINDESNDITSKSLSTSNHNSSNRQRSSISAPFMKRRSFETSDHQKGGDCVGGSAEQRLGGSNNIIQYQRTRPIATRHPNCTVYFADLAGFTKWSSTREPEEVFQLLEALFKEFDAAALRRGVFKVETIGDCYMAVTGLPREQPDHAVRMAKFANDCQHKLEQTILELVDALGQGTEDLSLRAGMHSGEVTAGVLRGEKGRFQLFGDTVNTASRMESTGVPRKIQVSQATADELILQQKENWLIARKEKIAAKGKGEMQTYFLFVKDTSRSSEKRSSYSST